MAKTYHIEIDHKGGALGAPFRVSFRGDDHGVDCVTLREARIYANGLKHGLTYQQADTIVNIWVASQLADVPKAGS